MIKMLIKMNEDRINTMNDYTPERVYSGLDSIFARSGINGKIVNGYHEYRGNDNLGPPLIPAVGRALSTN